MIGERQNGKKRQSSKKNQKSRQIQNGRKERATETKKSIRVLGRVIRYMATNYKLVVAAVPSCIILSVAATLKGMVFIQSLVGSYARPLAKQASMGNMAPDFSLLAEALCGLAALYFIGILAAYAYNRIMVTQDGAP